jgi:hypothetical protein
MNGYEEAMAALIPILHEFGPNAKSLYDVGVPMSERGFSQEENVSVLMDLEREKTIELLPGNQVRVLPARSGLNPKVGNHD